ncbi:MAG: hypothetical protein ACE5GH_00620 [Fidelibacterota bacterium]
MNTRDNVEKVVKTLYEVQDYLSRLHREMLDGSTVVPHVFFMPLTVDEEMARLIVEQMKKGNLIPEA